MSSCIWNVIADQIQAVETDENDKPMEDVIITSIDIQNHRGVPSMSNKLHKKKKQEEKKIYHTNQDSKIAGNLEEREKSRREHHTFNLAYANFLLLVSINPFDIKDFLHFLMCCLFFSFV